MRISIEAPDFKNESSKLKRIFKEFPEWSGTVALHFYKEHFVLGGFRGRSFKKWRRRKDGDTTRQLMVKSRFLRRSLDKRITENGWVIYTDAEYAKIHNEGGHINAQVTVRGHKRRTRSGRTTNIRRHSRKMNTQIPQRQFMDIQAQGLSPTLKKIFIRHIEKKIEQALRQ